jgi:hypothetical protein
VLLAVPLVVPSEDDRLLLEESDVVTSVVFLLLHADMLNRPAINADKIMFLMVIVYFFLQFARTIPML